MHNLTSLTLILLLASSMTSCTWVKLEDEGVGVALIDQELATSCQRLGTTQTTSKASIAGIDRSEEKLAMELLALAKNNAAAMGGDAITEKAPMVDGKQTFIVYRCQKRLI